MAAVQAKLLCSFGGDFVNQQGRAFYVGGKNCLVSIARSTSFRYLLSKLSELCDADPSSLEVRFQLTDGILDFRLVSVETNEDVFNMMEEFDPGRKIPVILFSDETLNIGPAPRRPVPESPTQLIDASKATLVEERIGCLGVPRAVFGSDYLLDPPVGPGVSGEKIRSVSPSLLVGQVFEDVLTGRNALMSAAINFALHLVRSDQHRVPARSRPPDPTSRSTILLATTDPANSGADPRSALVTSVSRAGQCDDTLRVCMAGNGRSGCSMGGGVSHNATVVAASSAAMRFPRRERERCAMLAEEIERL